MRYSRLVFGSAISLFALPALAAEPGTYRPGTPYYSTQAPSADICEQQCSGDAQCKGWNFVAVNPNTPNGVCEFNSTDASPVPSDISTSGSNGVTSYSRRVAVGGTSTVRVGTPAPLRRSAPIQHSKTIAARTKAVVRAPAQNLSSVRPGARAIRPGQNAPFRRVIREAVPKRIQPGQTAYRPQSRARTAPVMPRAPQRPRFRHNLDPGVSQGFAPRRPAPVPAAQPAQAPQHLQGGDPRLQKMIRQKAAQPTLQSERPTAPVSRPVPQPQARPAPQPPRAPQRPLSLSQAEQSLFGSLHDDVKMPKAMTAAEQNNPDEPIATVTSVPVKKVTTENLMGLAGAPNP